VGCRDARSRIRDVVRNDLYNPRLAMGALIAVSMRDADVGVGTVTRHAALLLGYGTTMVGVCALACIGPLLRIFRVEPTDVLRDDG